MNTTSFFKTVIFAFAVVLFASCDKDFNEIGTDIIGDDHFGFELDASKTVVAYDQKLGVVQSNNLDVNSLGYYNNPVFGKTKASFLTQVELASANPTIGTDPIVKKVELNVPYTSVLDSTNTDGDRSYSLSSIYGNPLSKIKLGVYASNYYLRDLDPASGSQQEQAYFSNGIFSYDTQRLNDSTATSQNDAFFFDRSEVKTYTVDDGDSTLVRKTPQMRLKLNKDFFQNKLFGASAAGQLVNNNTFKEYFRGLYFKAEAAAGSEDQGELALINFKQGTVTVTYTVLVSGARVEKTMVINLTGNTVNIFENEENPQYVAAATSSDVNQGDDRLYLKGGAGSMAVVEILTPTELQEMRSSNWLINEANLIFYIDSLKMAPAPEPHRIYLYDLKNNIPLADYNLDVTTSTAAIDNKYIHSGIIVENDDNRGKYYKIRITNHLKNLLKENDDAASDSTNVRLGLVVTQNINTSTNAKLQSPFIIPSSPLFSSPTTVSKIPDMSVANPLGTVLFGSNIPVTDPNYKKRLRLEIYYTKPNTN